MRSRVAALGLSCALLACGGDAAAPTVSLARGSGSARPSARSPDARPSAPPPAPPPIDAAPVFTADIKDWPIPWTADRQRLMLDYRRAHNDPAATDLTITPTIVVLHYTAGPSAKGTHRYFSNLEIEKGRPSVRAAGVVNVSAHFLVDRDGIIYRLVPETTMARHCIGLNHNSIGVENVGDGDRYPLTDAQVAANVALIRHLAARFPLRRVIGHSEARSLDGTPDFVELDPTYRNDKPDPGDAFLAKVRAQIADLGLLGAPRR